MPNVLLVDDNVTFARFMRVLLESKLRGVQVRTADCAAAARQQCSSCTVDLAILDVRLPDGNGLQLYEELAAMHPDMLFIMMSAEPIPFARLDDREKVIGVMIKPFSSEGVVALVRKALPTKTLGREEPRAQLGNPSPESAPPGEMKHQLILLLSGLYEIRQSLRNGNLCERDVHTVIEDKLVPLIDVVSDLSRAVSRHEGSKP